MLLVNTDNFFQVLTNWDEVRELSFRIGRYETTLSYFHKFLIHPIYNDIINGRSEQGFIKELNWLKNDIVRYLFRLNKKYHFLGYVKKEDYEDLIDEVTDAFADYREAALDKVA